MQEHTGLVAILDALGAASYSTDEIARFLESRERVLSLLNSKVERVLGEVDAKNVSVFTFNDTIVIAYRTGRDPTLDDIKAFATLLRHFQVKSLLHGILFRGAMAMGTYHANKSKNIIMGRAVTDAAAWYDKSDWIGIAATPQATLLIRSRKQRGAKDIQHVMIDFPVPMKDGTKLSLRAVNWPKGFYVRGLRPVAPGEDARGKCLQLLAQSGVPKGTEGKYYNTVEFLDHCIKHYKDQRQRRAGPAS